MGAPIIVHGDGSSRTVTHAEDFASWVRGPSGTPAGDCHDAFAITSDEVLTWNQIYGTIADVPNVEAHMIHILLDYL